MNRREFLTGLVWGGCATIPVMVAINESKIEDCPTFDKTKTYGYVSAYEPKGRYFKVFLDNEDVSGQCFEADDREGYVGLYDADVNGHIVYPAHTRRVYGKVRLVRMEHQ